MRVHLRVLVCVSNCPRGAVYPDMSCRYAALHAVDGWQHVLVAPTSVQESYVLRSRYRLFSLQLICTGGLPTFVACHQISANMMSGGVNGIGTDNTGYFSSCHPLAVVDTPLMYHASMCSLLCMTMHQAQCCFYACTSVPNANP